MDTGAQPALNQALQQLWIKFLPQMEERVSAMESANRALAEGVLSPEQRSEAAMAAHKLAGVLGTFGLGEGTELAREAELIYSRESGAKPEDAGQLDSITRQLTELIRNHS